MTRQTYRVTITPHERNVAALVLKVSAVDDADAIQRARAYIESRAVNRLTKLMVAGAVTGVSYSATTTEETTR